MAVPHSALQTGVSLAYGSGAIYSPQERGAALAIYRQHGPGEAARQTGIKRATISKWANRAGISTPRSAQTEAATQAAKVWALRRADLRDISGEAATEFLAEARRRMKDNARAATDHMRSFSIAVTTANTLAAQTAASGGVTDDRPFDQEVEQLVESLQGAARKQVREEVLSELAAEEPEDKQQPVASSVPVAVQNGSGKQTPADPPERPPEAQSGDETELRAKLALADEPAPTCASGCSAAEPSARACGPRRRRSLRRALALRGTRSAAPR